MCDTRRVSELLHTAFLYGSAVACFAHDCASLWGQLKRIDRCFCSVEQARLTIFLKTQRYRLSCTDIRVRVSAGEGSGRSRRPLLLYHATVAVGSCPFILVLYGIRRGICHRAFQFYMNIREQDASSLDVAGAPNPKSCLLYHIESSQTTHVARKVYDFKRDRIQAFRGSPTR